MKRVFVLSACLLIVSCASAQNTLTVKQAEAACGDFSVNFHVKKHHTYGAVPPVQKGKARIYVFENFGGIYGPFTGAYGGPTIRVGMDGQWIGADKGASYLHFPATPGEHHLCVNWQSVFVGLNSLIWLTNVNVQADQTYYFLVVPTQDTRNSGLLRLRPLDSDEAQLLLAEYPLALPTAHK